MSVPASAASGEAARLVGRASERSVLDRFLDAVRGGQSRALVLLGEPGIGKTALLEHLTGRAPDCRVVSVSGVQSEMELAFAALHQLCAPLLDRLEAVPAPQALALRTTFGLSAGPVPDRLLVGLAVLSLLAESAAERPLLCVVDDEQWLDRASAQAMAFAARRLGAESVGLIFAARTRSAELTGLPELAVAALSQEDAVTLLDSVLTIKVDRRVRDQMVTETQGNPLALVELPRELTAAELAGGFGLPGAVAIPGRAEEMYRRRSQALPGPSRRLLLLAAADPTGDPVLLWRAAGELGIGATAARPAVAAGLVEFGARVRFRHPLTRSAAYQAASAEERQEIHAALAAATDPALDPDRRAWHRAQSAAASDEGIAAELERSADRAQARGGLAAAGAFLERAAILTPDPAQRTRRALAAAQAKIQAGEFNRAQDLLALAEGGRPGRAEQARVRLARAQLAFAASRDRNVPALLLEAARALEPVDASLARMTYLDAIRAATYVGRFAAPGADLPAVARAVQAASAVPGAPGEAGRLLDDFAASFPRAGLAVPDFLGALRRIWDPGPSLDWELRGLSVTSFAASGVWDHEHWNTLTGQYVQLCRQHGALTELRLALTARSLALLVAGELTAVDSVIEELQAALNATGSSLVPYGALALAAFRGQEDEASALEQAMVSDATARGEGLAVTAAKWASAVLYNGLCRYGKALAAAQRATEDPNEDYGLRNWALAELVEAGVRAGVRPAAVDACRQLTEVTRGSGTDWALGVQARSRALLADGEEAGDLYREAVTRLGRTQVRTETARAHLLYGEWLRRERRRGEARRQLREAHEMFDEMGMAGFAERAGRELWATGETTRKRSVESRHELTAQESQIAKLAREGLTNPEIGTRLYISARTVEYHLGKVFSKLGITARSQLDRALP
jgi:DNA-binding CsgD family transcriptional regulator